MPGGLLGLYSQFCLRNCLWALWALTRLGLVSLGCLWVVPQAGFGVPRGLLGLCLGNSLSVGSLGSPQAVPQVEFGVPVRVSLGCSPGSAQNLWGSPGACTPGSVWVTLWGLWALARMGLGSLWGCPRATPQTQFGIPEGLLG